MNARFTIDGSKDLEERLEHICDEVRQGLAAHIPRRHIEAIVLGGGYGRGEGGVLWTESGDQPYNDLEFYVFLRGNRFWQAHRFQKWLHNFGEGMSAEAGIHVEFKIDDARAWKHGPVSMFSYDLVSRHRIILGDNSVFENCGHHLEASAIPLSEATRLMFNRCSGLLLARELLQRDALAGNDADFVGRNLAKMQLALGDAVLTAFGQYHWSTRERHRRAGLPWRLMNCLPGSRRPRPITERRLTSSCIRGVNPGKRMNLNGNIAGSLSWPCNSGSGLRAGD